MQDIILRDDVIKILNDSLDSVIQRHMSFDVSNAVMDIRNNLRKVRNVSIGKNPVKWNPCKRNILGGRGTMEGFSCDNCGFEVLYPTNFCSRCGSGMLNTKNGDI